MGRLDNGEFIKQFESVLSKNNGKSSVYLTQKRLTPALDIEPTEPLGDLPTNVVEIDSVPANTQSYPVLVRISLNGKEKSDKKDKIKLSTVVEPAHLEEFWTDYAQAVKNGFIGLKKKEKKKAKKGVTK